LKTRSTTFQRTSVVLSTSKFKLLSPRTPMLPQPQLLQLLISSISSPPSASSQIRTSRTSSSRFSPSLSAEASPKKKLTSLSQETHTQPHAATPQLNSQNLHTWLIPLSRLRPTLHGSKTSSQPPVTEHRPPLPKKNRSLTKPLVSPTLERKASLLISSSNLAEKTAPPIPSEQSSKRLSTLPLRPIQSTSHLSSMLKGQKLQNFAHPLLRTPQHRLMLMSKPLEPLKTSTPSPKPLSVAQSVAKFTPPLTIMPLWSKTPELESLSSSETSHSSRLERERLKRSLH